MKERGTWWGRPPEFWIQSMSCRLVSQADVPTVPISISFCWKYQVGPDPSSQEHSQLSSVCLARRYLWSPPLMWFLVFLCSVNVNQKKEAPERPKHNCWLDWNHPDPSPLGEKWHHSWSPSWSVSAGGLQRRNVICPERKYSRHLSSTKNCFFLCLFISLHELVIATIKER